MFRKQLFLYLLYYLFIVLIHLVLISVIAFFHFLLKYNLSSIEEWIFDNAWPLIIVSKSFAFFLMMLFLSAKDNIYQPLYRVLYARLGLPTRDILVVTVFSFIYLVIQGNPSISTVLDISLYRVIISVFGIHVFLLSDLILLFMMQRYYPLNRKWLWIRVFVFPVVFLVIKKFTFLYSSEADYMNFFYFFFLLFLLQLFSHNFGNLLCFILPLSTWTVLSGLDPIWGSVYAPITLRVNLEIFHFVIMGLIGGGYLLMKKNDYHLKVRDYCVVFARQYFRLYRKDQEKRT